MLITGYKAPKTSVYQHNGSGNAKQELLYHFHCVSIKILLIFCFTLVIAKIPLDVNK